MKSTNVQGNYGLFILDLTPDPPESGGDDIDATLGYIDQDTGIVYERDAIDGDAAADGTWTAQGKLLPFVGDQAPPAQVTGLTVTPASSLNADGTLSPAFLISWDENTEEDLLGYGLQVDDGESPTWANPIERSIGLTNAITLKDGLLSSTLYNFRIRALDAEGFAGDWSSVVQETSVPDDDAPEVPDAVNVAVGFKMLGVTWDKAEVSDFSFYQVRYYVQSEGSADATYLRTTSNRIVLTDLLPDTLYGVQVRSIDRSGNVRTSAVDATAVNFQEQDEAGWSTEATGTPVLVGAEDLTVDTLVANFISTGVLDASAISTGTLKVGGPAGAGSISVYNSAGVLIATLDEDGLVMFNPNNALQAMWLKAGSLKFTSAWDGSVDTTEWTSAVTPEGINASAITFGTGQGGANSVPNAGFELAAFASITANIWPTDTAWSTASSQVNLATGGASLTMTSV